MSVHKITTLFDIYLSAYADIKSLYGIVIPHMDAMDMTHDINLGKRIHEYIKSLQREKQYIQDNVHRVTITGQRDIMTGMLVMVDNVMSSLDKYMEEILGEHLPVKIVDLMQNIVYDDGDVDIQKIIELRRSRGTNMGEFVRDMKAKLYNIKVPLTCQLDRYGLICKYTSDVSMILGGNKVENNSGDMSSNAASTAAYNYSKLLAHTTNSMVNIIILYVYNPGARAFNFSLPSIKSEDSWKIINSEFVNRMTTIHEVHVDNNVDMSKFTSLWSVPKPGSLCSIYETYDYVNFSFITAGLSDNLVPWDRAYGYALAQGVNILGSNDRSKSDSKNKSNIENASTDSDNNPHIPLATHVGFNDYCNKQLADKWFRPELVENSAGYKFGESQISPLKDKIRASMIAHAEQFPDDPKSIDLRSIINSSIESVLSGAGREAKISSYIGSLDLIKQFVKEYKSAISHQTWSTSTYSVISMKDVFDQCSAKCDKLNAWQIDDKSPKDLFWSM